MNTPELIAEQMGRKIGLSQRFSRSGISVLFANLIILLMATLIAVPYGQVLACACSEVAIGQAAISSELNVDEMGELRLPQTDIDLPGVVPVRLIRQYQSANFGTGIFGMGWSVDFISYMVTTTGDLQINFTGEIQTFTASSGYYNAKKYRQASFTDTNEVTVTDKSGEKWIFDTTNRTLKEYFDINGNKTTYTWNVVAASFLGNTVDIYCPLTITFPGSRTIIFTYSTTVGMTHLCTQASSPSGFTANYTYTQNLLTAVSKSNGQTLAYSYHTVVNPSHSDWVQGWINKITYTDGSEINITYNGSYSSSSALKVTNISGPLSFDHAYSWNNGMAMTDSLGNITTSEYTNAGKTVKVTDALGNYEQTTKNDYYEPISVRNRNGNTTIFTYDSTNTNIFAKTNLLTIVNPLGKTWTFTYDSNNFLASTTDPLSHTLTFTNDTVGNVLTISNGASQIIRTNTYTTGTFKGLPATSKNGVNDETDFDYNSLGLLSKITDPSGKEWNFDYSSDGAGNLTKLTTPLNHEWKAEYNGFYKTSKKIDPLNNEISYDYDDMGNLTEIIDANGNSSQYTWDALQRVTQSKDALNNTTDFAYDAESNVTALTDGLSRVYNYTFDAVNRRKTFKLPDNSQREYDYNPAGYITKIVNWASKEIDFAYDAADRLTSKIWIDTTNTNFSNTYDDANRLIAVTKITGGTTNSDISYSYNAANKITATVAEGQTISYIYDNAQRTSQIVYPSSETVKYAYNSRSLFDTIKDGSNNTIVSYTYDDAGRLTKKTFPNGLECIYDYDSADRVIDIALRQTSSPTTVIQSFNFGYDKVGNKLWVKFTNGTGDVYQYDAIYQLTGVKYGVSNPTADLLRRLELLAL